jgi:hypothetical protein
MPHAMIREKIASGRLPLPKLPPEKVWVGHGNGEPCDGCDGPITPADLEYEADLANGRTLRFHKKCLAVWHDQRTEETGG